MMNASQTTVYRGPDSVQSVGTVISELRVLRAETGGEMDTRALFRSLTAAGLLTATVPVDFGGLGLCRPDSAEALLDLLEMIGDVDLACGRLFEAHVNALDLLRRYGTDAQFAQAVRPVMDGVLYGLWVTDPPDRGARLTAVEGAWQLTGSKHFCSGAGLAGRALITAGTTAGTRMIVIDTAPPMSVTAASVGLNGMRGAATGRVTLDGMRIQPQAVIGVVDDYLREPLFSAAIWRNYAVILGGTRRLIAEARTLLRTRQRTGHPAQRSRFGQAVIGYETARLWLREAAIRAEAATAPGDAAIAYVNLARIAVEDACLEVIRLVQRSLGVSAFVEGSMVEQLARDLAVYLRQPGPDEALDRAGAYCLDTLDEGAVVP